MKIIETKEIMENDVAYIVETYDDGHVVKKLKHSDIPVEPIEPEPSQLDRIEEQVNAIANGTTSENTEAIDALLGL